MTSDDPLVRIRNLPIWRHKIAAKPLLGGRTNLNYLVRDGANKYVVRLGADIPEHHVLRFNELAASRAAHAAGLSPAVIHAEDGVTVLDYIDGKTLGEADVAASGMLERVIALVKICHRDIPDYLRGPALVFWVFHVIRDYAAMLVDRDSSYARRVPEYLSIANHLEVEAGPFDIVFGHNDLMAANFLDDGARLWLIDWDYAGFNSPLFDLGGLASNNLLTEDQEKRMLELYFEAEPSAELIWRYRAMKCASLLREVMWSMVSELTSALDVDFAAYTAENQARFVRVYREYLQG